MAYGMRMRRSGDEVLACYACATCASYAAVTSAVLPIAISLPRSSQIALLQALRMASLECSAITTISALDAAAPVVVRDYPFAARDGE